MEVSFILRFYYAAPSNPEVSIDVTGIWTAGATTSLTCTISMNQALGSIPYTYWLAENGTKIENGTLEDVIVSRTSQSSATILTFSPLHSSHGGRYMCVADVNVSDSQLYLRGNASHIVTVQSKLR